MDRDARRDLIRTRTTADDWLAVTASPPEERPPDGLAVCGGQHYTALLGEDCETVLVRPDGPEFVPPDRVEVFGRPAKFVVVR